MKRITYTISILIALLIINIISGFLGIAAADLKLKIHGGEFYGDPYWDQKEYILTVALESSILGMGLFLLFWIYLKPIINRIFYETKEERRIRRKLKGIKKIAKIIRAADSRNVDSPFWSLKRQTTEKC